MLAELTAGAREDALRRERERPAAVLQDEIATCGSVRSARLALRGSNQLGIIAEIKRHSPSRGALAEIADPVDLARRYQRAGAHMISVLTEKRHFRGDLDDLRRVSSAVSVPVLRKDFISTSYQLLEARAAGADCVLLIVAAVPATLLRELYAEARALGLEVLVEIHSASELDTALELDPSIVGVNARDLNTFELDRGLFETLAGQIPVGVVRVAESAVRTVDDARRYRQAGADAILVGEALVTGHPETLIPQLGGLI